MSIRNLLPVSVNIEQISFSSRYLLFNVIVNANQIDDCFSAFQMSSISTFKLIQ